MADDRLDRVVVPSLEEILGVAFKVLDDGRSVSDKGRVTDEDRYRRTENREAGARNTA